MVIIISKYLLPKGYNGLTVFPFIILKQKKDLQDVFLINHEKIHIRQQMELLFIVFFLWYFLEYIIRFVQYKNHHLAYRGISFEKEAYACELDMNYLKQRSAFSFIKYC